MSESLLLNNNHNVDIAAIYTNKCNERSVLNHHSTTKCSYSTDNLYTLVQIISLKFNKFYDLKIFQE